MMRMELFAKNQGFVAKRPRKNNFLFSLSWWDR